MHQAVGRFIQHKMKEAHEFVRNRIEVRMTADEIYEELIGEHHVLEAFVTAMRYLPERSLNTSAHLHIGTVNQYNKLRVMLRLPPSEKYPHRMLPKYELCVTPQSKLAAAFAQQMKVTAAWAELDYVFERFHVANLDAQQMAHLFPWMRDLVMECEWHANPETFMHRWHSGWKKRDLHAVEKDMRAIMNDVTPNHFPMVTKKIKTICRNGAALFGQYRILKMTDTKRDDPFISMFENPHNVDQELQDEMDEIFEQWLEDKGFKK